MPTISTATVAAQPARVPLETLGKTVMTRGVCDLVARGLNIIPFIGRHGAGDWGDVCPEDWSANNRAAKHLDEGAMVLSSYPLPAGWGEEKIWLITQMAEEDLLVTTLLLPSEY